MYCVARRQGDRVELSLRGEWRATTLAAIEPELAAVDLSGARGLQIDANSAQFDLSGAWLLHDSIARLATAGVTAEFTGEAPPALALISRTLQNDAGLPGVEATSQTAWLDPASAVEGLGRKTVKGWRLFESVLEFIGRVSFAAGRAGDRDIQGLLHRIASRGNTE